MKLIILFFKVNHLSFYLNTLINYFEKFKFPKLYNF